MAINMARKIPAKKAITPLRTGRGVNELDGADAD